LSLKINNMVLANILVPIIIVIIGYLFGSIPSGVIVGKVFFKQDPRDFGSKNSGGTNASRLWGFKYGFLVYLFDFLKVLIPLYGLWAILTFIPINGKPLIPSYNDFYNNLENEFMIVYPVYWLIVPSCAFGHCYPIFANFKGGKAASVTFSSLIFTSWFTAIISIGTFAGVLKWKKFISLSSILGSLIGSAGAWLTLIPGLDKIVMYGPTLKSGLVFAICVTLASIILVIRHKANIIRIKNKEERKVSWF